MNIFQQITIYINSIHLKDQNINIISKTGVTPGKAEKQLGIDNKRCLDNDCIQSKSDHKTEKHISRNWSI